MPYSPILQFAAEHPWIALGLSWPTALLLIAIAWSVTNLVTNAMNTCAVVGNQIAATVMVLVRGYAPVAGGKSEVGTVGEDDEEAR